MPATRFATGRRGRRTPVGRPFPYRAIHYRIYQYQRTV